MKIEKEELRDLQRQCRWDSLRERGFYTVEMFASEIAFMSRAQVKRYLNGPKEKWPDRWHSIITKVERIGRREFLIHTNFADERTVPRILGGVDWVDINPTWVRYEVTFPDTPIVTLGGLYGCQPTLLRREPGSHLWTSPSPGSACWMAFSPIP